MATITLTISDSADGRVKIVSDPDFKTMKDMDRSGHTLTNAHGYAFRMINEALQVSKSAEPSGRIPIIRGRH